MDCSPQPPAKRLGGLLGFTPNITGSSSSSSSSGVHSTHNPPYSPTPNHFPIQQIQPHPHHLLLPHRGSPNSLETGTESSVSSVSGDSPSFFRPLDSPVNSSSDILSSDSPYPKQQSLNNKDTYSSAVQQICNHTSIVIVRLVQNTCKYRPHIYQLSFLPRTYFPHSLVPFLDPTLPEPESRTLNCTYKNIGQFPVPRDKRLYGAIMIYQ